MPVSVNRVERKDPPWDSKTWKNVVPLYLSPEIEESVDAAIGKMVLDTDGDGPSSLVACGCGRQHTGPYRSCAGCRRGVRMAQEVKDPGQIRLILDSVKAELNKPRNTAPTVGSRNPFPRRITP